MISTEVTEVIETTYSYTRLEEIGVGQGRNSTVYRAHDPQLGGDVAVKEILKSDFNGDPVAYFAEAKLMSAAECPNVVPIRLASAAGEHICLVMPYLSHGSLQTRISSNPLPLREVIRVGQGILKGLSQIHVKGIIHFDLKPSNVLFSSIDEPLVADFGQSRRVGDSGLSLAPPMYTPQMPPEVLNTNHGSIETDIYQAGLTLYRVVNGDDYFQKQHDKAPNTDEKFFDYLAAGKLPNRNLFLPHVPKWMRSVIRKSLHVDPAKRYASATEFANDLGRHDIPINWTASIESDGQQVRWEGKRHKKSAIVVQLLQVDDRWNVEVYHKADDGKVRKKGPRVFWRSNLKQADALKYLKHLFIQLV